MLQNFALRRNGLSVYEHLEVPEINELPLPTEPTDLFPIQPEHEDPANVVPMHLLNQAAQEGAGEFYFIFYEQLIILLHSLLIS